MSTRRIEPVSRFQKQYRRTVHGLGLLVKLCRNASHGRGLRRQGPGQPSQYFAEPPPHLEMQEPGNRFPARKERACHRGERVGSPLVIDRCAPGRRPKQQPSANREIQADGNRSKREIRLAGLVPHRLNARESGYFARAFVFVGVRRVSQIEQSHPQDNPIPLPMCLKCRAAPMLVTCTEEEYPGYHRRMYECPVCGETMTQWGGHFATSG